MKMRKQCSCYHMCVDRALLPDFCLHFSPLSLPSGRPSITSLQTLPICTADCPRDGPPVRRCR